MHDQVTMKKPGSLFKGTVKVPLMHRQLDNRYGDQYYRYHSRAFHVIEMRMKSFKSNMISGKYDCN